MKTCKEIMTKDPKCCAPSESLQAAARQMRDEGVGSILICEPVTMKLLGIVTDRDIVVKAVAQGVYPREANVGHAMTSNPYSCRENEDVVEAIGIMTEHQIRRLPILNKDGQLVGIISQGDIAIRNQEPQKTAEVVEKISEMPSKEYRQEHPC